MINSLNIATDFGPDSGGRLKGITVVKPIVYGNVARSFGKKREEDGHTHQWTVYVKPYNNEDMSSYVKKIHFKLHESYANPNRIISKPPYEVTETGWGEFEVVIKIYFHDPTERPVTLYHILKLFQSPILDGNNSNGDGGGGGGNNNGGTTGTDIITTESSSSGTLPGSSTTTTTTTTTTTNNNNNNGDNTKKGGLVSESYEEIVFQEPTQLLQHHLTNTQPVIAPTVAGAQWTHDTDFEEKIGNTLENIMDTKVKVKSEISTLKDKLKLARETILRFKIEMTKVQGNQSTTQAS